VPVSEMRRRVPETGQKLVRELRLHRRRSRTPWIYLVYHRCSRPAARATDPGHHRVCPLTLTSHEGRHIER